jgi:hypothetical protein
MLHTIEFDFENRWSLTTFHGLVRLEETIQLLQQSIALPEWSTEWDRISDYDDGLLGDLDAESVRKAKQVIGKILLDAYAGKPTLSAQVCSDQMKWPMIEYWIRLGGQDFPAAAAMQGTVAQAQAWILASRAARSGAGVQAQPV